MSSASKKLGRAKRQSKKPTCATDVVGKWPKVIRDPIHNIIPFEKNDCDLLLLNLIDTPEFQRLRRIKQLGMGEMVFPGSTHTRFVHSIGVMHTARRFLDRLKMLEGVSIQPEHRLVILCAALLHDLGHGPFSHAFEGVSGRKHVDWTTEIILSKEMDVHEKLVQYSNDPALPEKVALVLDEDLPAKNKSAPMVPQRLLRIVSSQLDADRFDYLLRDSHGTGAEYGRFDVDWLIQQLQVDEGEDVIYLSRKAFSAAEEYIFARYHMYTNVYFHKATRATEVMFNVLLKRFKHLVGGKSASKQRKGIVPETPPIVASAFAGQMRLPEFLRLDDYALMEFLKACEKSSDRGLRLLGSGLVHRRLYKCTDATDADPSRRDEFRTEAEKLVKKAGLDPEYAFVSDYPSGTGYTPYDPLEDEPITQIYVETSSGKLMEISRLSEPIHQLKRKYQFIRFYYPEEVRGDVRRLEDRLFRKGKS